MFSIEVRQTVSVSAVSLEDLVPQDQFYRHLEQVHDLTFVRQWVQDGYAANGRPSIDPVVFFKLQPVQVSQATPDQEHLEAASSLARLTPPEPLPVLLSDAQREDLTATNAARHDWIAEEGRQQREVHGVYQRTADVRISTTDPDARPMRLMRAENRYEVPLRVVYHDVYRCSRVGTP